LANIVAYRLHANYIPCQVATAANDWTGFCQHIDLGAAGGGHHDITSDHDICKAFTELAQRADAEDMPAAWVPGVPPPFVPNNDGPCNDLVVGSLEWVQMELTKCARLLESAAPC
jgi:hypothetical protein